MKRLKRVIAISFGLGLTAVLALIVAVSFAGVTLTVRNESKSAIEKATVDYVRGVAQVGTLHPGEEWRDDLGKIGEGADFFLSFQQDGARFQENFNVYFFGLGFRTTIVMHVLDEQQVRVVQEGYERFTRQKKATRMGDAP